MTGVEADQAPVAAALRPLNNYDATRWIGSSLARAMRRAQLSGIVLVQVVLLIAALASEISVPDSVAAAATGIVVLAGIAVWIYKLHSLVLIIPYYFALAFYYVVAVSPNDPLLGALVPLTSWTIPLALMLRQGPWPTIVPWVLTAAFAGLLLCAHPNWEPSALGASLVTNIIILTAATFFMRSLYRIAGSLDRQKENANVRKTRAIHQQAAQEMAIEYVRVLHDTIINTFGALAREGSEVSTSDARERCRRDLERISAFTRDNFGRRQGKISLTELDYVGLPVRWEGLSGDDLRRFQALLPVPVLNALYGCAFESVLNATKHSGSADVRINIHYTNDVFHVEISDDGSGFNRADVSERGIAQSLFARGQNYGIAVELDTASGFGTTVKLSYPLNGTPPATTRSGAPNAAQPMHDFIRGMGLSWSVLAVSSGTILEVLSPRAVGLPTAVLLMSLSLFSALVWGTSRKGRRVSTPLVVLMLAAIPAVNWCALVGVDYGRDAPYLFQAISLTVLPVLLYVSNSTFAIFFFAIGLQATSTLIITAASFAMNSERWAEIALLEAPTFALLVVWAVFLRMFRTIGNEIEDSRRRMERALRDTAAADAAAEIQLQWSASGLHAPFQLLQDIADGTISLTDPATRRRCGDEEVFLRQISGLPHGATFMGRWFALALAEARRKHVQLELNAENADIGNEQDADALGHLVLACIEASSQNCRLIVTLLQRDHGPHMLIVEQGSSELAGRFQSYRSPRLEIMVHTAHDNAIIEASVATGPDGQTGLFSAWDR